jgi:hypothetical protein
MIHPAIRGAVRGTADGVSRRNGLPLLRDIYCWGDSTTFTTRSDWVERLASDTGLTTYNRGVNGESTDQIQARFDAAIADSAIRRSVHIIMTGRNDLGAWNDAAFNYTKPNELLAKWAAMVASIGHSNYLIMPPWPDNDSSGEWSGGGRRTQIDYLYAQGLATYGIRFRNNLVGLDALNKGFLDWGNGTAQDNTDIGRGVPPDSLVYPDATRVHLTKTSDANVGSLTDGSAVILNNVKNALRMIGVLQNTAPAVNAGSNQSITLPATASLSATSTDSDGPRSLTHQWTSTGPAAVTFSAPTALSGTATFSTAGSYVLTLTSFDGRSYAASSLTVTVAATAGGSYILTRAGDRIVTRASDPIMTR